jgi:TrpR family trp operon transcriptional repressor
MEVEKDLTEMVALVRRADELGELETLLRALLTPQEIEEISRRWQLMQALARGETQRAIAAELGISLGKIARGSRLLKYDLPQFAELLPKLTSRT